MKKFRTILALLLVAMLVVAMFAACGQTEESTQQTPSGDNSAQQSGNQEQEPAGDGEIDYGDEEEDEMGNIEFWYFDLRMTGADYGQHVEDAINAITEEKINTHVNITWITVSDFQNKFTLAMSGGDTIDLVQIFTFAKLNTLYANNQLTDITALMEQYAPETLELMSDYIGTYTYDGKIYGVPTLRNFVTNGYIIMRKDILEEVGMLEKAENMSSWSEFEEIMAAVNDAYAGSGLYALCKGAGKSVLSATGSLCHGDLFADSEVYDTLGDSLGVVYSDSEGNVSLYQEQEAYKEELLMAKKWADNGWVYPDSSMIDTHGDELLKQGVAFATIQGSEIGVEVTKGNSCGYELVCAKYYDGMIKTSNLTSWGCGVPVTTENPAGAVKFINLMYTDAEIMNLLTWGVEGTDYEIENGQVKQPESGYYYEADFLIGNNTLLTPLYGNGADFYDRVKQTVDAAECSPYLGFTLNTADLDLVISQISAVVDQYAGALSCGLYSDADYEAYVEKLKAAGVQDYLDAIQTQLNAWIAAQ